MKAAALAILATSALMALPIAGCGGDDVDPLTRDAERLFGYDADQPLNAEATPLPDAGGLKVESVTYEGSPAEKVPALFAFPPDAESVPCLIFMHGYRGRKEDAAGIAGPAASLGVGVFSLDAPYHGARGSDVAEEIIGDPARLVELYQQTVVDLRRALDYLGDRAECDPERLGVIGLSFGGLAALLTAAVDERVRSAVTLSIEGGWRFLLTRPGVVLTEQEIQDGETLDEALETMAPIAAERWVGRIAPRALLMVNGRRDRLNPERVVLPLYRAAGESSESFWYDGGHNPFVGPWSQSVLDRITEFERESLVEVDDAD